MTVRGRMIVSGLIALVLLALVLRELDWRDVVARVEDADPTWLLAALFAYAASYAMRGWRFRLLLAHAKPPWLQLWAVMAIHNLMNMILPARTGELSWVLLAKSRFCVPLAEGAAALLVSRVYDVVGIALSFLAALLVVGAKTRGLEIGLVAGVLLVAFLALAALLAPLATAAVRLVETRAAGLPRLHPPLAKAKALVLHLQRMQAMRRGLPVLGVTLLQWLATFSTCYCLLRAAGADFPFGRSVLGSTGLSLALILPINTFGNVGTFEAGWTAGYVLAGMDEETAAATGVAAHVFILAFAAVLAGVGALISRRSAQDHEAGARSE